MSNIQLRYYQSEAVQATFDSFSKGLLSPLLALPTGCHEAGHLIMMYDGSFTKVEDVMVGDTLMSPDGSPRKVLHLIRGKQEMRKVIPNNGDTFVVNLDHKLSMYKVREGYRYKSQDPRIETVTLRDYEQSSKTFKHVRKLRRAPTLEFQHKHYVFSPYFIGAMIGDGCLSDGTFCGSEPEVINELLRESELKFKCKPSIMTKKNNKAFNIRFSHGSFLTEFKKLSLWGCDSYTAFIPNEYKTGSVKQRRELLAGLIDTDGHFTSNGWEYCTVSGRLAKDVRYVAQSLGLRATMTVGDATLNGRFISKKYRIFIYGSGCEDVKTRLKYKRCKARGQIKNQLVTGFTIEKLPVDNYYGFELDGDKLYIDSDFIVHHNSGKGFTIAEIARRMVEDYSTNKVVVLSHVKEIVDQNHKSFIEYTDGRIGSGLNAASLSKHRDYDSPVIFANIQSVARSPHLFGDVDAIIVDECQRIPKNGSSQYRKVIDHLRSVNPQLVTVGLSATPYRTGNGHLTDPDFNMFSNTAYDITGTDAIRRLISEGFMFPLVTKPTDAVISTENLTLSGGEFDNRSMGVVSDDRATTIACLKECMLKAADRRSWLIFAANVEHSKFITQWLNDNGVSSVHVDGTLVDTKRDNAIDQWKAGNYRALVNVGIATTGLDHKPVDFIGILRPVRTTSLHIQILGRGARPFHGDDLFPPKLNCLVLDFPNNTKRCGFFDAPTLPKKRESKGGTTPIWICPSCETMNHAAAKECFICGFKHVMESEEDKIEKSNTASSVMSDAIVKPQVNIKRANISTTLYSRHLPKKGLIPSVKVGYVVSVTEIYTQYLHIERRGFMRKEFVTWWENARVSPLSLPPVTVGEFLTRQHELKQVHCIDYNADTKYNEIIKTYYKE